MTTTEFALKDWVLQCRAKILEQTTDFSGGIRKGLNLGFKALIQLQKKNHTEDWALGCHPRDNGDVTH